MTDGSGNIKAKASFVGSLPDLQVTWEAFN
jgi:hypothetical protein